MKNLTHSARGFRAAAFITCAAILLALIFLLAASLKFENFDTDPIYASVFRLHIRANSDSDTDQATKLAVRDALLPYTAVLFADCGGLEDAVLVANEKKDEITAHIDATLGTLGSDYTAKISIGKEEFPERNYGGEVYPAGEYTALIVELGEGEGQNWWCVLFPSLCLSAVKGTGDSVEAGLTPEQYRIITEDGSVDVAATNSPAPKYRLKFRFFELIEELFER